jgi:hypothetical protein
MNLFELTCILGILYFTLTCPLVSADSVPGLSDQQDKPVYRTHTALADSVPGLSDQHDKPADRTHVALDFAKRVFHGLGDTDGNVSQTASQFQAEFDELSAETGHTLGDMLTSIFVMRVADLSATLDHTLTMQSVVHELVTAHEPAPPPV